MDVAGLLADAFGRVREEVHAAVAGLSADELAARLDERANSVAWLVWHLTRVQDDHIAEVAEKEQVWSAERWAERFGLPRRSGATGYGDNGTQVARIRADAQTLLEYHDAVQDQTLGFVRGLRNAALDRVVDESWDPPVTLGVRLISVISDDLQHVGQAAFVRGVLLRRR